MALTRRGFLSGCAAAGLGAAAYATFPTSWKSLSDFGAVADGTYHPATGRMAGTDNTDAINAALTTGNPVVIPPGLYYYAGSLHTDVEGSGLIGSGSRLSYLITDRSRDRHISVVAGTTNTQWINFGMIGPFDTEGDGLNRAITIGVDSTLTDLAGSHWDAAGTWIDEIEVFGYRVGLHVAHADNVEFGSIGVFEAGDSKAEPGSYGVTCSGSNLRGRSLRAVNTTTRARHALYYTGSANDCFVELVEAKGFDLAAVQNRFREGGGQRNGFGFGKFIDCNTNEGAEPVNSLRGVVNFGSAGDIAVAGAGGARIGDYYTIDCGGFPGPSLKYVPHSRCGTVTVFGHSGDFTAQRYGAHIDHSNDVKLPLLVFVGCFSGAGLNRAEFDPLVVDDSVDCYGGGVRCIPAADSP
ncbi:twin-arginine translocation signal domain-containing protein [Mycobacterium sp. AMU20-3851]|uniref:twin-arginine translocation signal domain-containing protein n=1 Tax=Mycobacterium sp. AMU20-3851 TaxID=3122055 RepID=UPI003754D842